MNVIIVHGMADNKKDKSYSKYWILWIKKELEKRGIKTITPLMPKPWAPDYNSWKKEFNKLKIDEDTILIGHSCGCSFLVRWLGDTKKKINKLILVAPWKIPDKDDEVMKKFYIYPINKMIKNRIKKIIIFTSNDEEDNGKESVKIFYNVLKGKLINLKNHGHFTEEDMGTNEFPKLLEEILK